jgi:hypothetical protein
MSALTSISSSVTLASPTINSSANNTPTTKGENLFVSSLGTITGTTTINLASAQVFVATLTSAGVTFAFSNAPAQGEVVMFRLTNGGLGTVNWPANTKYPGGNSVLGLTSAGVDMLGVYYDITTTTYMVFTIGLDIK